MVRDRIDALAAEHDVVVTTSGTSMGHKDYVIHMLEDLGEVLFHQVCLRPGKPIAVAQLPDTVAIAIPRKPLGAYMIATLVMRPFFIGDARTPTVETTLTTDVGFDPKGFEYVIAVLLKDGDAVPIGHVDSPLVVCDETFDPSVASSSTRATRADGFVFTRTLLKEGAVVDVTPYPMLE